MVLGGSSCLAKDRFCEPFLGRGTLNHFMPTIVLVISGDKKQGLMTTAPFNVSRRTNIIVETLQGQNMAEYMLICKYKKKL